MRRFAFQRPSDIPHRHPVAGQHPIAQVNAGSGRGFHVTGDKGAAGKMIKSTDIQTFLSMKSLEQGGGTYVKTTWRVSAKWYEGEKQYGFIDKVARVYFLADAIRPNVDQMTGDQFDKIAADNPTLKSYDMLDGKWVESTSQSPAHQAT